MPRNSRRAVFAVLVTTLVLSVLTVPPANAAPPVGLAGAHWVWYPEGDPRVSAPAAHRYFRKSFTVPAGAVGDAQLVVTGDDTVDVWLNGKPLASSPRDTDAWRRAMLVDLRPALVAGANTLAIASRNSAAGPAGLIAHARVVTSGGTTDFGTDGTWKASRTVGEGWEQPGFADGSWPAAADLGAYGTAPWQSDVAAPDPAAASPLRVASATVGAPRRPARRRRGTTEVRLAARVERGAATPGGLPGHGVQRRGHDLGQRPGAPPASRSTWSTAGRR